MAYDCKTIRRGTAATVDNSKYTVAVKPKMKTAIIAIYRSLMAFSSAKLWSNFRCFLSSAADLLLSASSATIKSSSWISTDIKLSMSLLHSANNTHSLTSFDTTVDCNLSKNLHNLQNVVRIFKTVPAEFASFWPKPGPNPNHDPSPNCNLTLILNLAKSSNAFCKLCTKNSVQHYYWITVTFGLWSTVLCHLINLFNGL